MHTRFVLGFFFFVCAQGCSLFTQVEEIPDAGNRLQDASVVMDAGAPSDAGGEDAAPPVCTPDPDRLNGVRRCQVDEQCPCGAHCTLGRCIYECLDGVQDCADGQRCSLFGRCVEQAAESEEPRAALSTETPPEQKNHKAPVGHPYPELPRGPQDDESLEREEESEEIRVEERE